MKKLIFPLTLLVSVLFFNGCSKDDDGTSTPLTKSQLLTAQAWKLTGSTSQGVDDFASLDACEKDDITTFASAGTGVIDEGATKCDPTDPQTTNFNWSFKSNETVLGLVYGTDTLDWNLVTLTESQLKLSFSFEFGGVTFTSTKTFGKP